MNLLEYKIYVYTTFEFFEARDRAFMIFYFISSFSLASPWAEKWK